MNDEPKRYTPVATINKDMRCAVLEDGRICEFSTMYDRDGEETNDIAAAVTVVAPHPEGAWLVLHMRDFEGVTLH